MLAWYGHGPAEPPSRPQTAALAWGSQGEGAGSRLLPAEPRGTGAAPGMEGEARVVAQIEFGMARV